MSSVNGNIIKIKFLAVEEHYISLSIILCKYLEKVVDILPLLLMVNIFYYIKVCKINCLICVFLFVSDLFKNNKKYIV